MAGRMTGSDVQGKFITADTQALDADGISTAASVGNNAALTIGGALADGGACAFDSGRIVTILSAGNDSSKSFSVVGTNVNGDIIYGDIIVSILDLTSITDGYVPYVGASGFTDSPIYTDGTNVWINSTSMNNLFGIEDSSDVLLGIKTTKLDGVVGVQLFGDFQQWIIKVDGELSDNLIIRENTGAVGNIAAFTPSGNMRIGGDTLESWQSNLTAIQIGGTGALYSHTTAGVSSTMNLSQNMYKDPSNGDSYIVTDKASQYLQQNGTHYFNVASSGTAGTAITWTSALIINNDGTLQYGTHTAIGAETVTGYITIKDAGGTTRKLAVVS